MSGKTVQWLFENATRKYSGSKLMLLVSIGWIIRDEEGSAAIALTTLLDRNGLQEKSRPHLIKMLKELEQDGTLVITRTRKTTHKNEPNRYAIPLDPALYQEGSSETATASSSEKTTTPTEGSSETATTGSSEKTTTGSSETATRVVANPQPLKGFLKGSEKDSEKEEGAKTPAAPAAPAGKGRPVTEADAERIWRQVTSMITIPGGAEAALQVTKTILELADKHGEDTAQFLKPYWQAHSLSRTANGTQYSRTKTFWLDTWAVAEEIPEQQLAHIRSLPAEKVPPELKQWIASRGSNGKPIVAAGGKGLSAEELAAAGQAELQKLLNRRQQTTGGTNGK